MDGARDDSVISSASGDDVATRKEELRAAAKAVDPFKPLRDHPYLTLSAAAALGAIVAAPELTKSAKAAISSSGLRMILNAVQHLGRGWIAGMAQQQAAPPVTPGPEIPTG